MAPGVVAAITSRVNDKFIGLGKDGGKRGGSVLLGDIALWSERAVSTCVRGSTLPRGVLGRASGV